jgi:hypothetical protein
MIQTKQARSSRRTDPDEPSLLTLTFDNRHSGTYIVDCTVRFDTPDRPDQIRAIVVCGHSNGLANRSCPDPVAAAPVLGNLEASLAHAGAAGQH